MRLVFRLHIFPTLGKMDLSNLSPREVRAWHSKLTKARQPGAVTVAKAYRLLRAVCETALSDEIINRNPCKLKGASVEHSPERPVTTLVQVSELFDAIEEPYKAMVVLAAWCSLRLGELLALTTGDIDLSTNTLHISKGASELRIVGPPKTQAGIRTVAMPPHVVSFVVAHLRAFGGPAPEDLDFVGPSGGPLRRPTFYAAWARATKPTGLTQIRFHDLRHTGATWAAATGATTRELMSRLRHASSDAALRYQHATAERDQAIARRLSELARLPEAE